MLIYSKINNLLIKINLTSGLCISILVQYSIWSLLIKKKLSFILFFLQYGKKIKLKLNFLILIKNKILNLGIKKLLCNNSDLTSGLTFIIISKYNENINFIKFYKNLGIGYINNIKKKISIGTNPVLFIHKLIYDIKLFKNNLSYKFNFHTPNGININYNTLNNLFNIKNGISIIGTSGLSYPYSITSWVNSLLINIKKNNLYIICFIGSKAQNYFYKNYISNRYLNIKVGNNLLNLLNYVILFKLKSIIISGIKSKIIKFIVNINLNSYYLYKYQYILKYMKLLYNIYNNKINTKILIINSKNYITYLN